MTVDGAQVYWIKDRPTVLKVSPSEFPDVIAREAQRAWLACEALGSEIGSAIAVPLSQWRANGVSCALFEELFRISSNRVIRSIQLLRLTPLVLDWLRRVAEIDRGPSQNARENLEALAACPYEALHLAARDALTKMTSDVVLQARVMHGDMWAGNIMLNPSGVHEFMVIDWAGSNIDGFPIFDLVRFAQSVRLTPRRLRLELATHAQVLGCELTHTRTYLLAALGYFWLNLEQFPPERFAEMGERSLRSLDAALNA